MGSYVFKMMKKKRPLRAEMKGDDFCLTLFFFIPVYLRHHYLEADLQSKINVISL